MGSNAATTRQMIPALYMHWGKKGDGKVSSRGNGGGGSPLRASRARKPLAFPFSLATPPNVWRSIYRPV